MDTRILLYVLDLWCLQGGAGHTPPLAFNRISLGVIIKRTINTCWYDQHRYQRGRETQFYMDPISWHYTRVPHKNGYKIQILFHVTISGTIKTSGAEIKSLFFRSPILEKLEPIWLHLSYSFLTLCMLFNFLNLLLFSCKTATTQDVQILDSVSNPVFTYEWVLIGLILIKLSLMILWLLQNVLQIWA